MFERSNGILLNNLEQQKVASDVKRQLELNMIVYTCEWCKNVYKIQPDQTYICWMCGKHSPHRVPRWGGGHIFLELPNMPCEGCEDYEEIKGKEALDKLKQENKNK